MEIDKIFGLPAHPLFVHIPIVMIPLLALATIAVALVPRLRSPLAAPLALVGVLTMIATLMTAGAGEKLEHRIGPEPLLEEHAELGDQTKIIMIVFAVVLILLAVMVRRASFVTPIAIIAALVGIVTTVWVVRTGHAGAKSVWNDVPAPKAGEDDEGATSLPGVPGAVIRIR